MSGWITPFPHCRRLLATRRAITLIRRRRSTFGRFYQKFIDRELNKYANVRIYERNGRFFLIYDDPERGTGGFKTRDEAIMWFVRQGR